MGPFKYLLGDYGDVKWKKKNAKCNLTSMAVFNCLCGAKIMVSLKIAASFPYKYLYYIGSDEC